MKLTKENIQALKQAKHITIQYDRSNEYAQLTCTIPITQYGQETEINVPMDINVLSSNTFVCTILYCGIYGTLSFLFATLRPGDELYCSVSTNGNQSTTEHNLIVEHFNLSISRSGKWKALDILTHYEINKTDFVGRMIKD